ncbi:uncharacterized protein LOC106876261 [Octopus bimaculoides]|nr:uncharacterized protein LOC106876261 [Octopus bimaculoides]|eukprot:XP_014780237.1 PREDICTED: uncharacterized protein LOC106876261 [Octopus bimaculoides]
MRGDSHRKITKCTAIQNVIKSLQLPLAVVLFLITSIGMSERNPCTLPSYSMVQVGDLNAKINKSNFHLERIITKNGTSSYHLNDTYHVYYIGIDNVITEVNKTIDVAIGDGETWKKCTYTPSRTTTNNTSTDDILCEPNAIGDELKTNLGDGPVINIFGVHIYSGVRIFFSYPNTTSANMTVYFGDTFVTSKYVYSYDKICLSRHATQDPVVHVSTDIENCHLTNVTLKFVTKIVHFVAMTLTQKALGCKATFNDYNWLLLVKSNASSEFPVNNLTLIINKKEVHKVSGIRSGFTDIFLVPGLLCKQISSFYMAAPNSLKLNVDEVIAFSDACNMSYTFVHGEILTEQLYVIHNKAENPVSVKTITGSIGIDDGVVLRFSGAFCALNVTLDTADDDFRPNSADYFNSTIPDCGPLKCIKVLKFGTNSNATLSNIIVIDHMTGISIEAKAPGTKTHCVDEFRGAEKWIVTLSSATTINRLTMDFEGSILNEEYFYLGSLKAIDQKYNINLRDIGKLLCLHLTWYPSFDINNRTLTLTREQEKYTFLTSSHNIAHQATYPVSTCHDDETLTGLLIDDCIENVEYSTLCDRNNYFQLKNTTIVWLYSLEGYTYNHVNLIHNNTILSSVPIKKSEPKKSEGIFCYDKEYLLQVSYLTTSPPVHCKTTMVSLVLLLPNNIRIQYHSNLTSEKQICEWEVFPAFQTILNTTLPYGYAGNMSDITTAAMETSNYTIDNTTAMVVTVNGSDCETINGSDCGTNNDSEYFITSTEQATDGSSSLDPDVSTTPTVLSTSESITLSTTDITVQDVITVSTLPTTRENTFTPLNSISTTELTSESTPSNTSIDISCLCPCPKTQKNLTQQELTIKLHQIVSELTLPRNKTSKYIRSKVSMPDDRQSSFYVSGVILIVVITPFVLIVLQDLIVILREF